MDWKKESVADSARLGTLLFPSKDRSHPTPCYIPMARRGALPSLTPDIMREVASPEKCPIFINFWDVHDPVIRAAITGTKSESVHGVYNFRDYSLIMTHRDPFSPVPDAPSTDSSISSQSMHGRQKVEITGYLSTVQKAKPEAVLSMADHIPSNAGKNKTQKSMERSIDWLSQCTSTFSAASIPLFASIQGARNLQYRLKCTKEAVDSGAKGVALCGFNLGETAEERDSMIAQVLEQVPEDRIRLIFGFDSPEDVLNGVSMGIDAFDGVYPFRAAEMGTALIFDLDPSSASSSSPIDSSKRERSQEEDESSKKRRVEEGEEVQVAAASEAGPSSLPQPSAILSPPPALLGRKAMSMHLRDRSFAKDKGPLVDGCTCRTCRMHSRGYIHHLLNAKEMLADVLLTIHNLHHYYNFFDVIRTHLRNGTFSKYKEAFTKNCIKQ